MRVAYQIQEGPDAPRQVAEGALALAVSDWDGVHQAHVALARRAAAAASALGGQAIAVLPWPTPDGGDGAPDIRLTTLEERIARLDALGCFDTLVVAPTPAEARAPQAAVAWLRGFGDVRALLGEAHATGAMARLWPDGLASAARALGVTVEQRDDVSEQGARIREMVEAGLMREATAALGYTYSMTGEVVGGDRRGRLLGFPTANVRAEPSKLPPRDGIYAAWAHLPGAHAPWPAVISIGVRPTFGQGARRQVEAHLLDATMDLYGIQLRLEFVEWLRAELRFDNVEALIEQMCADREQSREILRTEAAAMGGGQ